MKALAGSFILLFAFFCEFGHAQQRGDVGLREKQSAGLFHARSYPSRDGTALGTKSFCGPGGCLLTRLSQERFLTHMAGTVRRIVKDVK